MVGRETPESANSLLLMPAAETVTGDPVAPRVAVRERFAPTTTLPKLRLAGETDNWPCAVSVPESAIFSVESFAVDRTASVPLADPVDAGAKVTVKVTLCFEERVTGKVSPLTEKPVPLTVASEIVSAAPPALVSVSERSELLLFCTLPKESVDDDATRAETPLESLGATPWQPVSSVIPAAIEREPIKQRCDRKTRNGPIP